MAVSSYGASVALQNNSGSAAASGGPTGSVFLFASGAVGSAKLYLNQEGSTDDLEIGGDLKIAGDSGTGTVSLGSGQTFTIAGGTGLDTSVSNQTVTFSMDLNELSAAAVDVANDSIAIIDANDSNGSKKESIADLVTGIAGDGLAASSGVLSVGVDDATVELNSDALRVKDGGIDADALATSVAGDGLTGGGGSALAVQVSGSVVIASDKVGLSGSVAGDGLTFAGGKDSISSLALDISEFSDVAVASGDKFLMLDSNGSTHQLESVDDIASFMAGDGLAASSGVLAVGVDDATIELNSDALRIKDGGVDADALASSVAGNGLAGGAGTALSLDLNELSAAAVAVGADSIAIIDADDNSSKKEAIADLVTAMAGDGLAASSGVLAVQVGTNKGLALTSDKLEITGSAVADDTFMFFDADGSVKEESFADYATAIAGAGLGATSGALRLANATNGGLSINTSDMNLDLSDLAAAAVSVANDSIAIIDADDSNNSKKESIADLVAGIASTGLDAASGQLSVDVSDFMDNGSNNRIITAKDADSMNAEANLTFDGSTLTLAGAMSGSGNVTLGGAIIFEPGLATAGIANSSGQAVFGISSGQVGAFQSDLTVAGGFTVGGGFGSTGVSISNSGNIQANGSLELDSTALFKNTVTVGSDGSGADFKVFGAASNEFLLYDVSENLLKINGSGGDQIVAIGGDATSEFAIDVANGSNNQNKVRAAAFVTYSDESLKQDVQTMNTALDTVMSLNGVEFTWKDSGERDFGFIAQDVQNVLPKAVHTAGNGVQGVDYSRLTSVLVEAVKAQQVQIEELKALLKK